MSNKYPINHEITTNGIEMVVDEALSDTSSNPVANWVLKKAIDEGGGGGHTHGITLSSTTSGSRGSGNAHNNLQPYITCYMFKRTA